MSTNPTKFSQRLVSQLAKRPTQFTIAEVASQFEVTPECARAAVTHLVIEGVLVVQRATRPRVYAPGNLELASRRFTHWRKRELCGVRDPEAMLR